ncbi:MAG: hypothetical protein ACXWUG_21485 [Polyangiales bacterium]
MRWPYLLGFSIVLSACGGHDDRSAAVDASPPETTELACFGTGLPDSVLIDPDDPHFSDEGHTEEQVKAMFADAKAKDTAAYRAYRAARANADVLPCAFCACGCATAGHRSAIDCYKDLHGFG